MSFATEGGRFKMADMADRAQDFQMPMKRKALHLICTVCGRKMKNPDFIEDEVCNDCWDSKKEEK
jgi:hypothetical protein